jgi:phosphatidylglycerophosphatase A
MEPAQQLPTNDSPGMAKVPFVAKFLATGFYSGYVPFASGTAGSLVGILIYLIPGVERGDILSALIVLGFLAGVFASAKVAAAVGNRLTTSAKMTKDLLQGGNHETPDPSIVVIDEIVGMWISLLFLPKSMWVIVAAFVLFRIFDIVKPPPARQLERIPNGWGIMLDDVLAGVYANICCRGILFLFPHLI